MLIVLHYTVFGSWQARCRQACPPGLMNGGDDGVPLHCQVTHVLHDVQRCIAVQPCSANIWLSAHATNYQHECAREVNAG